MKIAVIDNYDSFVYNIIHYLQSFDGVEVDVFFNDGFILEQLENYDKILLSPGPGLPKEAGLIMEVIDAYKSKKSILGVCLGHQAIAEFFGCELKNLEMPLHGISSQLNIVLDDYLWENLPKSIKIGHYHSWVVNKDKLTTEIIPIAYDAYGNITALKHSNYDIRGLQFHPESILTDSGKKMLMNWIFNL